LDFGLHKNILAAKRRKRHKRTYFEKYEIFCGCIFFLIRVIRVIRG